MSTSPINVAKAYLANNAKYHFMEDGKYTVDEHDAAMDAHTIKMLGGVENVDSEKNQFSVVTIEKHVQVEGHGNLTIPKIVKIQVSKIDNTIQSVLESK